ncbi:MAG: hypothetical protein COA78_32455 [Blastopirellula sp.]|nr:MAG: hypothetical protein COA78_32455 [Blastopirellula sp.]
MTKARQLYLHNLRTQQSGGKQLISKSAGDSAVNHGMVRIIDEDSGVASWHTLDDANKLITLHNQMTDNRTDIQKSAGLSEPDQNDVFDSLFPV